MPVSQPKPEPQTIHFSEGLQLWFSATWKFKQNEGAPASKIRRPKNANTLPQNQETGSGNVNKPTQANLVYPDLLNATYAKVCKCLCRSATSPMPKKCCPFKSPKWWCSCMNTLCKVEPFCEMSRGPISESTPVMHQYTNSVWFYIALGKSPPFSWHQALGQLRRLFYPANAKPAQTRREKLINQFDWKGRADTNWLGFNSVTRV